MDRLAHSIEEAADCLGVGRSVLCELIRDGRVKSVKIGRRRLIPDEALRSYLQGLMDSQQHPGAKAG
jgi:excisionase family DNA binding protein